MRREKHLISFITFAAFLFSMISSAYPSVDEECIVCHQDPELKTDKGKSLFVDFKKFLLSVHGEIGLSCLDCHSDLKGIEDFPHPERLRSVNCGECHDKAAKEFELSVHSQKEETRPLVVRCSDCHGKHNIRRADDQKSRVFPFNLPQTCENCHLEKVKTERGTKFIKQYQRSVHFQALKKAGLTISANCSHCHGAHDIKSIHDSLSRVSRKNIIRTCGQCHVGIERDYLEGVHGKAFLKGVREVPVCTDCHSEHGIASPQDLSSKVYATKVAGLCSSCHDDEALARQYGFLTSRLKTYSNAFHGIASKFGETRVANCASCHGFHDIRPSSDPQSSIHPDNLAKTCGKCHPGAGKNFTKGKIHVISEKRSNKWAYFVKMFYVILIAGIIGVFLIFIGADLFGRLRRKWKAT